MSGLHNQCHSSLKDYEIVARIFADIFTEVDYFDESSKENDDIIVTGTQLEIANTEIEDANLVAGWQPCVDPEPLKEMV
jgi:hypothetical protein